MDLPDNIIPPEQLEYIVERLARDELNLVSIQEDFNRLFPNKLSGELLMRIRKHNRQDIVAARKKLYIDGINDLPIAHSYTIMAISQIRVEDLLKNPKIVKQIRRLNEATGLEFNEDVLDIDDKNIQTYLKIAQDERYLNLKLELDKLVKDVDKKAIPKTGFKPIQINVGFEVEEEPVSTNEEK